jgi:hypothetical protein
VILFCLNAGMIMMARFPVISFVPGMFFGFASFFATYFGGFGWDPVNPWVAWVCVIAMLVLGPVYAWLAEWLVKPLPVKEPTAAVVPSPTQP